jgi:hypothetical protein
LVSDSNSFPLSTVLAILIPVLLILLAAIGFFVYRRKSSAPKATSPEAGEGPEPQIFVSGKAMKTDLPRESPSPSSRSLPPTMVPISPRNLGKKPSDIMEYKTINDIADMYSAHPVAAQSNDLIGTSGTSPGSLKLGTTLQGLAASAGVVTAAGLVKNHLDEDVKMDSLDRVHSTAKRTVDSDDIVYQSPGRLSFYPDSESDVTSVVPSHKSVENLKSVSMEEINEMKDSNSNHSLHRSLYSIPEQSKNELVESRFSFMSEDMAPEVARSSMISASSSNLHAVESYVNPPSAHAEVDASMEPSSVPVASPVPSEVPNSVVESFSSASTTKPDLSPLADSNSPVSTGTVLGAAVLTGIVSSQVGSPRMDEKQVRFEGESPADRVVGKLAVYKEPKVEEPSGPVIDKKAFPVAMVTEEPGRFELTKPIDDDDDLDDLDNYAPPAPTSHVVIATYYPQNADEMLLQNGDLIGIEKEYGDGWARGQNISQRRKRCVFPLAVLKPITSGPSQAVRRGRGNVLRVNRQETDVKQQIEIPKRTKSIRRLRRNTRNSLFSVMSSSSEESAK